jgi:hypothetical protein
MTATNDPLARVQAMVSAWGATELFDTFDTSESEVSLPKGLENCGFGHSRHFRHQETEHVHARHVHLEEQGQEAGSRVSYSSGVESVESVERIERNRKYSGLIFDTTCSQVSKNRGRVSKTGCPAGLEAPLGTCAPAGVPAEWVQGVARLAETPCPARFPAARWPQVITDAAAFLERWAAQAAALGWSTSELFGCDRRAPWQRLDAMGLVLLLRGKEVVALTNAEAVIRLRGGRVSPTGLSRSIHSVPPSAAWSGSWAMRELQNRSRRSQPKPINIEVEKRKSWREHDVLVDTKRDPLLSSRTRADSPARHQAGLPA